ncbi:MAG TPA: MarR family winged helix-turn-helix transcriptional regulator [Roseiarcus sp.]|jgi:DNA-binding MarR family transcriptional regulator
MKDDQRLGGLIEIFVNKVSHPRGRVLNLMARASVTVPQAILLNFALTMPDSKPSSLAARMRMSRPSVSQMVDRLVRLKLVARAEDPTDRRRKTIRVTAKGRSLLARLSAVRSAEFLVGAAGLSAATRARLIDALEAAVRELELPPAASRTRGASRTG